MIAIFLLGAVAGVLVTLGVLVIPDVVAGAFHPIDPRPPRARRWVRQPEHLTHRSST